MIPDPAADVAFEPAVSMARQALYRFAALTWLDPQRGSWEQIHTLRDDPVLLQAAEVIREAPQAKPEKLGPGEQPLARLDPELVLVRLPASRRRLNDEYERTFGLLVSGACPPYETEYIDGKFTFQRSNALADIGGFYRAFGFAISDQQRERGDHVTLELEFMACLIDLERRAAGSDVTDRQRCLQVCRDAQARFLREHLAWWAPAFAKLVSRESPAGFYASAATFLSALIPVERGLLAIEVLGPATAPSRIEPPEDCEGCPIGSL